MEAQRILGRTKTQSQTTKPDLADTCKGAVWSNTDMAEGISGQTQARKGRQESYYEGNCRSC